MKKLATFWRLKVTQKNFFFQQCHPSKINVSKHILTLKTGIRMKRLDKILQDEFNLNLHHFSRSSSDYFETKGLILIDYFIQRFCWFFIHIPAHLQRNFISRGGSIRYLSSTRMCLRNIEGGRSKMVSLK